jgi:hypothetical protein
VFLLHNDILARYDCKYFISEHPVANVLTSREFHISRDAGKSSAFYTARYVVSSI